MYHRSCLLWSPVILIVYFRMPPSAKSCDPCGYIPVYAGLGLESQVMGGIQKQKQEGKSWGKKRNKKCGVYINYCGGFCCLRKRKKRGDRSYSCYPEEEHRPYQLFTHRSVDDLTHRSSTDHTYRIPGTWYEITL